MPSPASACASGIYAITNTTNGKQYIGSAANLSNRWAVHRYKLNKGKHHCHHLQYAWRKYGEGSFTFTVLEYVSDVDDLLVREQYYLDTYFAANGNKGYNSRRKAESNLGTQFSAIARANM